MVPEPSILRGPTGTRRRKHEDGESSKGERRAKVNLYLPHCFLPVRRPRIALSQMRSLAPSLVEQKPQLLAPVPHFSLLCISIASSVKLGFSLPLIRGLDRRKHMQMHPKIYCQNIVLISLFP
jgi:hypothetical protein